MVWRVLPSLLSLLPLILLFQNCGQDIGTIVTTKQSPSSKDSGNSTGYGGKIVGNYSHYVPDFKCDGRSAPMNRIELVEYPDLTKGALLYSSSYVGCDTSMQTLDSSAIDQSSNQTRVIGYEDQIFESNTLASGEVPSSLVEIWCVDRWENPSFEIISEYDAHLKQTKTEVNNSVVSGVSRVVAQNQVHLSSEGMSLKISKKVVGSKFGTFLGVYEHQDESRDLDCRLGGYLDARIWPAKLLGRSASKHIQWSSINNKLYFIHDNSEVPLASSLMEFNPSSFSAKSLVGGHLQTPGVSGFVLTPDHQNAVLSGHLFGDLAHQLYRYSFASNQVTMLNAPLSQKEQSVDSDLSISSDGSQVFYRDGSQETGGDIERWLRTVPLFNPGEVTQINQNLPFGGDVSVNEYVFSNDLNSIAYTVWDNENTLWIADLKTSARTKLFPVFPGDSDYYSPLKAKMRDYILLGNSRYLATIMLNKVAPMNKSRLIIYDLLDGSKKMDQLVFPWATLHLMKDSSKIFVADLQNLGGLVVDLNSFTSESVTSKPIVKNGVVFQNSDFVGVCGPTESLVMAVDLDHSNDVLLLTSGSLPNALRLWRYTPESKECGFVNSVLLSDGLVAANLREVQAMLSPGNAPVIALQLSAVTPNDGKKSLSAIFIVPEGGRSPIEISHGITPHVLAANMGFTSSGRELFFQANSMGYQGGVSGTFVWRLPEELSGQ